jgi:hypothetical protein
MVGSVIKAMWNQMHPAYGSQPRPPRPSNPGRDVDFGDGSVHPRGIIEWWNYGRKHSDKWIYNNRHGIWGAVKTYGPMLWQALRSEQGQAFMQRLRALDV